MGGRLTIHVTVPATAAPDSASADDRMDVSTAIGVARRVEAWAGRLTRFDPSSEVARLNADAAPTVAVGPTLGTVLAWGEEARHRTGGIVDVRLLRERLTAEGVADGDARPGAVAHPSWSPLSEWSLERRGRGTLVTRPPGLAVDIDGVAKGWIADRALRLLRAADGAIVDADGDVALRLAPGEVVDVGVADPRNPGAMLAWLHVTDHGLAGGTHGIATSGVSVHRWRQGGRVTHHLIDPRTRRPADTDILQATVLARSAREAEILAKSAVILGRDRGVDFLENAGAAAAVLLTTAGECIATARSLDWLAA